MSKYRKKVIIPKTIGRYAGEQYRKSWDFRKAYDDGYPEKRELDRELF